MKTCLVIVLLASIYAAVSNSAPLVGNTRVTSALINVMIGNFTFALPCIIDGDAKCLHDTLVSLNVSNLESH